MRRIPSQPLAAESIAGIKARDGRRRAIQVDREDRFGPQPVGDRAFGGIAFPSQGEVKRRKGEVRDPVVLSILSP
jgi:hypothetical protein